ncbi:beta-N-acetylhexosaminidase [Rhizobium rhizogenes]|uniref:beta-N-acetylhexosaminidase n=1 Tax=Rhizobium rhizogenes TaxID=359 RepID=A0AA92H9V4_RHIRH|nr:family 20 glycosylhydrolase [Rhizobium rhizogenes]PVE55261.1 beta-N-acetylhexosaminidase [Rhizobium rhizogenes]PVE65817.1 beta-N-acetylhexosaminidase [Agrobacterium tumefaciens]PVE75881.1 beta-N-acetylhexosaminidase [Sphingomonas sp. TPD3009]
MSKTGFRLENAWHPIEGDPSGGFVFTLVNLTDKTISDFKLAYTALTRVMDNPACENVTFLLRNANFHQYAPPAGFVLEPGASWRFTVRGLWRPAKHRTDGAKSAYLTFSDGTHHTIDVADLMLEGRVSEPQKPLLPEGRVTEPFSLLPWPKQAKLQAGETPVALYPAAGSTLADVKAMDTVLSLHRRLFSAAHQPFSLIAVEQGKAIRFQQSGSLAAEAYELTFAEDEILLAYGGDAGRQYGLTALAQLHDGARRNAALFRFPGSGTIKDEPRYGWRGCHLDVSRQFAPAPDVLRLIDILAWYKMNVFHWHLTDDEAWRFEVRAYPQLTTVGVMRGPDEPMLPQLGNAAEPVGGFYTQADVAAIIAHASELNVEVVPEVDIPGHSTAILAALPELVDGQEAPDSYRSVQGFPNNALNPAIEETYVFLGKVFDEMVELFPSKLIHIGGDEVADNTWMASPLARKLMEKEGLDGTFGLQSHFMKRIQKMLADRGRSMAGWDEVSHGGGVDPDGTLLMAWRAPEVGVELAKEGYDVVMTPGQAYYLDMVQDEAWQEPGASWAGTVPPHHTYHYEAVGDFPEDLKPRLRGVQACIWTEHFLNRDYFNHLVFPRLPAVAEAAWTPRERKDWDRFSALVRLSPTL